MEVTIKKLLLSVTVVTLLSACGPKIPIIGLNADGNVLQNDVPAEEYSKAVNGVLTAVQESTLPVLEKTGFYQGWGLRSVVVGLGVSGEAGIGPISFGASSRFRLVFTNSLDPAVP